MSLMGRWLFRRAFGGESSFHGKYFWSKKIHKKANAMSEWDEELVVEVDPKSNQYRARIERTHSMGIVEGGKWSYFAVEKFQNNTYVLNKFITVKMLGMPSDLPRPRFSLTPEGHKSVDAILDVFRTIVYLNCVLFVFNLLPVPPLDGSHFLKHAVNMREETYYSLSKYGIIILLVLINIPYFRDFMLIMIEASTGIFFGIFFSLIQLQ